MTELRELVVTHHSKDELASACSDLANDFAAGVSGVKGFTLRSALSAAKRSRPDLMHRAAARLLPEFLDALDPLYGEWLQAGEGSCAQYFQRHRKRAAEALLTVADERAGQSSNRMVTSLYQRMRAGAPRDVERMLPELAKLIDEALSRGKSATDG